VREAGGAARPVGVLFASFFYSDETRFPGYTALLPCLGAALIIYAGNAGESLVGRLLGSAPLNFIGKISYSLYLWHWPLFALYRYYVARALTPSEAA
jgi:peptidoglycan/LPS O-acetylase OafA/YrhL